MEYFWNISSILRCYVGTLRTSEELFFWTSGRVAFFYMKKFFWLIEICIIRIGDHSLINNKTYFQKKFPKKAFFFYVTRDRNLLHRSFFRGWDIKNSQLRYINTTLVYADDSTIFTLYTQTPYIIVVGYAWL